ncbi:MAG: 50S ribosomal protein L22 [Thermotogaceae bacterium]|nr:50S ribosomal protein L22 [Thermotogaceae bacterium]
MYKVKVPRREDGKRVKRSIYHRVIKEEEAKKQRIEARAVAKFVRISPRKARSIINAIRGKDVNEAFAILMFSPKKAARIIYKVLNSAVANAVNNFGLNEDALYVSEAYVNDGPRLKRIWPRGRGRADIIKHRYSHITVIVRDREKEKELNKEER